MKKTLLAMLMVIGVSICVFAEEVNNIENKKYENTTYKNETTQNNSINYYKNEAKQLSKTLMYYKKVDKNNLYWKYKTKNESKSGAICGTMIGNIIGDLLQSKQKQITDQIMISNKIK